MRIFPAIILSSFLSSLSILAQETKAPTPTASEPQASKFPIVLSISSLEGLSDIQWRPIQEEEGKKFREGLPKSTGKDGKVNKGAVLPIPAWWDLIQSARPPVGSRWTLGITYKDTATKPIGVQVCNGMNQRFEVHRIGGFGDGKWKTADIPTAWDYLFVTNGSKSVNLILLPETNLAVSAISIREGTPEDETKWEAETRDWVKRRQLPKRKDAVDNNDPETPELGAISKTKILVPFVRNYMKPIFSNSAPQKGEFGKTLKLRMALNEYEPGAFGVYANNKSLTDVKFDVSALKGEGGELLCKIEKRTAEYALISCKNGETTFFPERLWPMYPVNISSGNSHWFWIILKTDPSTAKPGKYQGTVTITSTQATESLPIEVEVLDLKLLTMDEANLRLGGCCNNAPPLHEISELIEYNHNDINLWAADVVPILSKGMSDSLLINFKEMDDWMIEAHKRGLQEVVWFLGEDPYGYPKTMSLERNLYSVIYGPMEDYYKLQEKEKGVMLPKLRPLYSKFIKDTWSHAKQSNWPELIFTPFDEPAKWAQKKQGSGEWIKRHFKDACKVIHENAPGCRIYGSIHHAESGIIFLDDVDVFCTNAIHEDDQLGEKVRAKKKTFWQYSGNSMSSTPDTARYTFGWYFGVYDSRGSLVWAYNWFDESRFDNSEGENWGYGWASPTSLIPAPYMEGMREGLDDRRYLETLNTLAIEKHVDLTKFKAEFKEKVLGQKAAGGKDAVTDFWEKSNNIEALDEFRSLVIDEIIKIKNPPTPVASLK